MYFCDLQSLREYCEHAVVHYAPVLWIGLDTVEVLVILTGSTETEFVVR